MDINTTQLDPSSIKELINTIMPQDDPEEGCSGIKGPDQKADSKTEQADIPPGDGDNGLSDQSDKHNSGDNDKSYNSSDEGEHSSSRKCKIIV